MQRLTQAGPDRILSPSTANVNLLKDLLIMRALTAAVLAGIVSTGAAWAGVVPNQHGQSMSGAKIKPPAQEQDKQASEHAAEKEEAPRDEKR
jgi:hypothetical protein